MFSLVGNRRGRKVIRWGHVVLVAIFITLISGPVAAALYAAIARAWEPRLLMVGPVVGLVATLFSLVFAWSTPLQRLPMIR